MSGSFTFFCCRSPEVTFLCCMPRDRLCAEDFLVQKVEADSVAKGM